jgi:sterol desaturase/sphingolipid hydroxylase (fatty acid hydroxylase superfamily)
MREVNYGESYVPFDFLAGTFAATVDDAKKIIDARIQKDAAAKKAK